MLDSQFESMTQELADLEQTLTSVTSTTSPVKKADDVITTNKRDSGKFDTASSAVKRASGQFGGIVTSTNDKPNFSLPNKRNSMYPAICSILFRSNLIYRF